MFLDDILGFPPFSHNHGWVENYIPQNDSGNDPIGDTPIFSTEPWLWEEG